MGFPAPYSTALEIKFLMIRSIRRASARTSGAAPDIFNGDLRFSINPANDLATTSVIFSRLT